MDNSTRTHRRVAWVLSGALHLFLVSLLFYPNEREIVKKENLQVKRGISTDFFYIKKRSNQNNPHMDAGKEELSEPANQTQGLESSELSRLLRNIPYPVLAQKMGMEGRTTVLCSVNEAGSVTKIETLESSGYDILDRAALEGIRQWSFQRANKNRIYKIPVRFEITPSRS